MLKKLNLKWLIKVNKKLILIAYLVRVRRSRGSLILLMPRLYPLGMRFLEVIFNRAISKLYKK